MVSQTIGLVTVDEYVHCPRMCVKYHLTGDFCGLSSRSAIFSAEILPGLNKGPFLVGA